MLTQFLKVINNLRRNTSKLIRKKKKLRANFGRCNNNIKNPLYQLVLKNGLDN